MNEQSNYFKQISAMIRQARLQQGITEQQLADKCGTTKANILKAEKDIGNIDLSILQKIVKKGLGGTLNVAFEF